MIRKHTRVFLFFVSILGMFCFARYCRSQAPPNQWQKQLQLPSAFTLKYEVVESDVRGPRARANFVDMKRKQYDQEVRAHRRSQADADRLLQVMAQSGNVGPQHYTITISTKGGKLLYQRKSDTVDLTMLYDGKDTYAYLVTKESKDRRLLIDKGFSFYSMLAFPLPAASPPFLNIASKTPTNVSSEGNRWVALSSTPIDNVRGPDVGAVFSNSRLVATLEQNKPQMQSIELLSTSGTAIQRWDYHEHKLFAGLWIASRMSLTDFDASFFTGGSQSTPSKVFDYTLVEARSAPIETVSFDPRQWLTETNTAIQDNRSVPGIAYYYTNQTGAIEDMTAEALQRRNRVPGSPKIMVSGVFISGALICLGTAMWWNRRKSRG